MNIAVDPRWGVPPPVALPGSPAVAAPATQFEDILTRAWEREADFLGNTSAALADDVEPAARIAEVFNEDGLFYGTVPDVKVAQVAAIDAEDARAVPCVPPLRIVRAIEPNVAPPALRRTLPIGTVPQTGSASPVHAAVVAEVTAPRKARPASPEPHANAEPTPATDGPVRVRIDHASTKPDSAPAALREILPTAALPQTTSVPVLTQHAAVVTQVAASGEARPTLPGRHASPEPTPGTGGTARVRIDDAAESAAVEPERATPHRRAAGLGAASPVQLALQTDEQGLSVVARVAGLPPHDLSLLRGRIAALFARYGLSTPTVRLNGELPTMLDRTDLWERDR